MSRSGRNYGKKPPDIGLQMDCYDEALTPEQVAAYNKGEKEYKEVMTKLEQMMKNLGGEIIEKSDSVCVMQMNNSSPPPVPALSANTPSTGKSVTSPATRQSAALIAQPTPATSAMVQAIQTPTGPVILQGSPQAQGVMTRASAGNALHSPGTYQLVMDPRLGLIVGAVTSPQATQGTPVIQNTTSLAKTPTVVSNAPTTQTRSTVHTRTNSMRMQPNTVSSNQKVPASKPPSPAPSPATPTPTVPSLRIKPPKPPANPKAVNTKTPSPVASKGANSAARPTESNSVGGLSTGPGSKPWRSTTTSSVSAPVVDLTDDDGKPSSPTMADSREVTFNKLSGKTFPSLVVVARPHLRIKDMAQGTVSQERAALDSKVKSVLMFTPTKFTEWLIQQGLVRSEQYCTTHVMPDNVTPITLKLGMYSDVSKFPYSGGYVWISECCPQRFVSVFSGSIFEGAPHPPTVLLKLIYHWACQTNVQNVVQWVKVDNFYVKNFFTNMRSVCTAAIHEKYEKMGGLKKRVEVGVISLGTTSQDGNMRQVKVEVLGVMDPESKLIRLRAVEPLQQEGERNYKRRFVKILEPLEQWVDKDSIILTDFTVDKGTLHNMGFSSVYQVSISDAPTPQNKYSNQNVMDYLRRIVPRMFQNTLSLLSRQIIQQFLDELVWRERWGPVASQAFDNIIAHMAEQTKLETGDSLLTRLSRVAANPFKHWQYSTWKTAPTPKTPIVTNGTSTPSPAPPSGPVSSIDMLPQSIRTVDPPASQTGKRGGRKRPVPVADAPEPKKFASAPQPAPPIPEEQIVLDTYYYAALEGDAEIVKEEFKNLLTVKCCVCQRKYSNNISLMKHLIMHAQSENQFLTELSDLTQCKYCLKSFPTPFSMQTHVEEIHLKVTNLVCRICEEKFRDKPTLISHMHRTHIEVEMPYECGICRFRSSMHRDLIDHFYEIHSGGEKMQCPFCLKIVAFANHGKKISANVNFFLNHIQKHQRKSIARKCNKCTMWFVHKGILKEHQIKDHSSFKGVPGVKPYVNPTGVDIMMPLPPALQFRGPSTQKKQPDRMKSSTNFANKMFEPPLAIYGVQSGATCCECEGEFLGEDHFPGYLTCSRCRFATCCSKAMVEHIVIFHESGKSTPEFTLGRMVQLPADLFCVCGFKTCSGNRLANHLAKCERKSAYPTPAKAKAATIQSASFPPLVTLDDADNASEDPSDQWLKAFVPSRKEEPGEGSKDTPDKKQAPQAEGGDPPSMLNILGLVRKPSTDESSLDRAPSDSEGLPDSKTEQLQAAEISEPPKQENSEVVSSELTGKDEGEKITEEGVEQKKEVDEVEIHRHQPVAAGSTPARETLPDDCDPTEEMLLNDSIPGEETSPGENAHAEDALADDSPPSEDMSDDNAPAEEISPDGNAPAEEMLPDDRMTPVDTEENCQASESEDNRHTSFQSNATVEGRLSPHSEDVGISSPVTDGEIRSLQPPVDTEESVASPLCSENEHSDELKDHSELCEEGEPSGDREVRSSTNKTEVAYAENVAAVSPANNEVLPLSGEKLSHAPAESTDISVAGNIVPLLQEKAGHILTEENEGGTD